MAVQSPDAIAVSFTAEEVEQVANFQAYGFLPELLARFSRFVPFEALDASTLMEILRSNVLDRLIREFEDEGFELVVDEPVLEHIVHESLQPRDRRPRPVRGPHPHHRGRRLRSLRRTPERPHPRPHGTPAPPRRIRHRLSGRSAAQGEKSWVT